MPLVVQLGLALDADTDHTHFFQNVGTEVVFAVFREDRQFLLADLTGIPVGSRSRHRLIVGHFRPPLIRAGSFSHLYYILYKIKSKYK